MLPLAGAAVLPSARSPASATIALRAAQRWSSPRVGPCPLSLARLPARPPGMQFQERHTWIPSLNVEYRLGVDGLGLLMVLLSAIVVPMAIAASWRVKERVPLYFALVLLLQSGPLRHLHRAEFLSLVHLLGTQPHPRLLPDPAVGRPPARPAATQFFIYTMVGSVTLLLSFLALHLATGTFDFTGLAGLANQRTTPPRHFAARLSFHGMPAERIVASCCSLGACLASRSRYR